MVTALAIAALAVCNVAVVGVPRVAVLAGSELVVICQARVHDLQEASHCPRAEQPCA